MVARSKIDAANTVLSMFAPETEIEKRKGGWYVCWTSHSQGQMSRRWQTNGGQDFYPVWHRKWGHGGTATTALSQLIRWLRGQPVLPLATWKYWASPGIRLIHPAKRPALLTILHWSDYPDPCKCVLCQHPITGELDWWSLDGVSGPCCGMRTGCRQQRPKAT